MRPSAWMIAVLVAGCEKSAPPAAPPPPPPPPPPAPAATAPPRDLQALKVTLPDGWVKVAKYPGCKAKILTEEILAGGFAATIELTAAAVPQHPKLEFHSVHDVGDQHIHCECEWAPDGKIRDQVATICKSASW